MKKNIFVTFGLVLIIALIFSGLSGCTTQSTTGKQTADVIPTVLAEDESTTTSTPDIHVSVKNQAEGIWVSGTGKVTTNPDIATLQLGIEAQEASVSEAQEKAKEAMDKVMKALTEKGIEEKDIQTQYFRIYQRTRWDDEEQQEVITGYQVSNMVLAKIRDIEKVSDIIESVVVAGGDYTRINDLNFSIDDPTTYYDRAREKAMADAKQRAEQIASLAGLQLGEPSYISESVTPVYQTMVYGLTSGSAQQMVPAPVPAMDSAASNISPGAIEINVNMQIAYKIAG